MDNIKYIYALCEESKLEATEQFWQTPLSELAKIYNGAGPDWFPGLIRKRLTKYLDLFQPAFLEHDFSFHYSDKTPKRFKEANKRLYRNSKRLISNNYSWLINPLTKSKLYIQSYLIYFACQKYGWSAWID